MIARLFLPDIAKMVDEIAARDVKVGLPLRLSVGRENVHVIRGCLWSNQALGEIDALCHSFFVGDLDKKSDVFREDFAQQLPGAHRS